MAEGSLKTAEMRNLLEGWGPRAMTVAHDVVENIGGGLAGAIAAKWGTGPAYAIGIVLQACNGIAGPSHPWIGMGTSLGSGLVAGANALKVYSWIRLKPGVVPADTPS
jgi:hypothetical protein